MAESPLFRRCVIGILVLVFLAVAISSWNFIRNDTLRLEEMYKEPFETYPTRAANCQCLPGYIPSNKKASKYGGKFIWNNGGVFFVADGSQRRNWVPNCIMCGINICDWNVMNKISNEEFNKLSPAETFTCDHLKKAQEAMKKSIYFCQSLSDPNETRKCY